MHVSAIQKHATSVHVCNNAQYNALATAPITSDNNNKTI